MAFKSYSKDTQTGGPKKKKPKQFLNSKPTKTKIYVGMNDLEISGQKELFDILYKKGEKKSFLSGKRINSEAKVGASMYVGQFAHVLSKAQNKHPKFKLYSKNIVLLTNEEHLLLDHGTKANRERYAEKNNCSWSALYALREALVAEYKEIYGD